ncbi:hypothetical protein Hanom_Chr08g00721831 [Helianthus anomalus]
MFNCIILPRNYHNWVADYKIICFYQDLALAQGDFLYCQTSQFSKHKDYLLIDRFFVHYKLKNILPTKHVTITVFPNHIWLVVM